MKAFEFVRFRRWVAKGILVALVLAGCLLVDSGTAFAAKAWVATDTFRVMNFAVLFFGLFFLLRKPMKNALNARIKGIKDQLDDLETRKKVAEKELARYNAQLASLDQESKKIVDEYIKQGEAAQAKILAEAESAAEKLQEQAHRNIEHEFKQAELALKEEILENALQRAEEIIMSKVSTDDQERLVDDYLKKVVA
jgi:F-type H+-transporting ATPase subunit b